MSPEPELYDPKKKKTGFAHLFAATKYSIAGGRKLLEEAAFRHEIFLGVVLMGVYWLAGVSLEHALITLSLFFVLFAVEALNTAIELVVDRTSPEFSEYAKNAKDLSSFAVSCVLCAIGIFALYALWSSFTS